MSKLMHSVNTIWKLKKVSILFSKDAQVAQNKDLTHHNSLQKFVAKHTADPGFVGVAPGSGVIT
jgi:hypothetical protein